MTVESIPPSSEEIRLAAIEADSANYHLNTLRHADYRRNMFWRWLFSIRHFIARLLGVDCLDAVIGGVLSAIPAFAIVLVVSVILGMRVPFVFLPAIIAYAASAVRFATVLQRFDSAEFKGDCNKLSIWLRDRQLQIQSAQRDLALKTERLRRLR